MTSNRKPGWLIKATETVLETYPFNVESLVMEIKGRELDHRYFRIACGDWVNVLPITTDGRAVLIKQMRPGSGREVMEVPGGLVDAGEKNDPTMAAVRELEEETGFTTQRILPLLSVNPNPAMQTNRVHMFVALDCHMNPDRKHFPDQDEAITVVLQNAERLDFLVRTGQIDHALSALCIMLAARYVKIVGQDH
jgi:8-oxo-dGTP pyrophosphatase MutT (NUDIX family)